MLRLSRNLLPAVVAVVVLVVVVIDGRVVPGAGFARDGVCRGDS